MGVDLTAVVAMAAAVGTLLSGLGALAAWRRVAQVEATAEDENVRRWWHPIIRSYAVANLRMILGIYAFGWFLLLVFRQPVPSRWAYFVFAGETLLAVMLTAFALVFHVEGLKRAPQFHDGHRADLAVCFAIMALFPFVLASHLGWFSFSHSISELTEYVGSYLRNNFHLS